MEEFSIPGIILRDIWNMHHFNGTKEQFIKEAIRAKHHVTLDIKRIKYLINMVDGWKKDTYAKSRYKEIGTTRKEWINDDQTIDMVNVGHGRGSGGVWVPSSTNLPPVSIPASIVFQEKKAKKTLADNILIFMAADCEYCNYSKREGFYYDTLKRIKQKYDKYYYIREIITSGNPTEGLKNPETRETALYYLKEMGTTKANFDFYFPAIRIQGNSWGVMCQYRLGIHLKLLFELIDLIHTQKLLPGQKLAPPYHTGKYMEDYGLGKKGR